MPIRVVLVDDHPIVLHGLQLLFQRQPDFEVVACCPDPSCAIERVTRERPDVLVLDLKMPRQSGLDVLRALSAKHVPCRTVLLTAAVRNDEVREAVTLGVLGLVFKESAPDVLIDCVRRASRGEPWMERETATQPARTRGARDASARAGFD